MSFKDAVTQSGIDFGLGDLDWMQKCPGIGVLAVNATSYNHEHLELNSTAAKGAFLALLAVACVLARAKADKAQCFIVNFAKQCSGVLFSLAFLDSLI